MQTPGTARMSRRYFFRRRLFIRRLTREFSRLRLSPPARLHPARFWG